MLPKSTESNLAHVSSISEIDALPTDTAAVFVVGLDDNMIAALRRLNSLRVLHQDGSPEVTDVGLSHLVALPTLEVLDLEWSTGITDQGLKELQLLANLRWLDLTGCTQLSDQAITDLANRLPRCEIVR